MSRAQPDGPASGATRGLGATLTLRVLAPAAIGVATGTCVAAAGFLVEQQAVAALAALPGLVPALFSPLALLVSVAVARFVTRVSSPSTAELYIETYHRGATELPLRQIPGRVLAAATTVGFGGSQGLESPSALMGAGWGDVLGRVGRGWLPPEERRTLLVAGASAGIGAVFSSPAVGTLYGIEIPFKRDVDAPRLVPCAIAAGASYATRAALIGTNHLVTVDQMPAVDARMIVGILLVGVACGLGARLFAMSEAWLRDAKQYGTPWTRALVGGVVLAALALAGHALTGQWITFGPGYLAAGWLTSDAHALWLLVPVVLVRTAGTLACVYGGGGGGVFTSLACTGAFVGQIVAQVIGRGETHLLALVGAACFLGSGYRIPLACMLFVAEESGEMAASMAGLIAIAIGQVFMGDESVSDAQVARREDDLPAQLAAPPIRSAKLPL